MGKSTNKMAIFNSELLNYQRVSVPFNSWVAMVAKQLRSSDQSEMMFTTWFHQIFFTQE